MDPLLRITMLVWRIHRTPWGRAKTLLALATMLVALAIGLIDWLGYWPDAMRVQRARGWPDVGGLERSSP